MTQKGLGWTLSCSLGQGGTAPVFEIITPDGPRALKIYDPEFSIGEKGRIEEKRIHQQLALKDHDCPNLVKVYDGGRFEDRLYLLMERASGQELEKRLGEIPRGKIRQIVDQVARAAIYLRERDLCHRDIKAANVFVSNDFEHCTLLDISVIRDIHDPVGVGTDHDGQLPVVATARYSPPEYLFRLLEPGPALWHALNIYQLGALLHDLIMRQPLFESEYQASRTNRYRFAWSVATMVPKIRAEDVDKDLVFIARRALDKDWERRSDLQLEDFLQTSETQQVHALKLLGIASDADRLATVTRSTTLLRRLRTVTENLDQDFSDRLRRRGATSQHTVAEGTDDFSKTLNFHWKSQTDTDAGPIEVTLQVSLTIAPQLGKPCLHMSVQLQTQGNDGIRKASLHLPETQDEPGVEALLIEQLESALASLATQLTLAT